MSLYHPELTPEQIEAQRALQIKVHYCELIQHEIQKLTSDQLFKMLVLIKNTIDENKESEVFGKLLNRVGKNSILFDPKRASSIGLKVPRAAREASENVRFMLAELGFTKGYGICEMVGGSSNSNEWSNFICFCVPNKMDGMIEVSNGPKNNAQYILSCREVGSRDTAVEIFFGADTLSLALKKVKEQYKNE